MAWLTRRHSRGMDGFNSQYVNVSREEPQILKVQLPDGDVIGMTAAQVVAAVVTPLPNVGRSRIRFDLAIELEANGSPEAFRDLFASALLGALRAKEAELKKVRDVRNALQEQVRTLEGDLKVAELRATIPPGQPRGNR